MFQLAEAANGNAHAAIAYLRAAAELATVQDRDRITCPLVDDAVMNGHRHRRSNVLEQFDAHEQAVYEVLQECEECQMAELYERYSDRVDNPLSRRHLPDRVLAKLEHYDCLEIEGKTSARRYIFADN